MRLIATRLLLIVVVPLSFAGDDAEHRAAQFFHKLGGELVRDPAAPGRPVVNLDLSHARLADTDLRQLAGLVHLRDLNLSHGTGDPVVAYSFWRRAASYGVVRRGDEWRFSLCFPIPAVLLAMQCFVSAD